MNAKIARLRGRPIATHSEPTRPPTPALPHEGGGGNSSSLPPRGGGPGWGGGGGRQRSCNRPGRRGFSLVEMLAAMSTGIILLGLATALIASLMKLDRAGRARLVEESRLDRLAHAFRADVRAATGVSPGAGPAAVQLILPGGFVGVPRPARRRGPRPVRRRRPPRGSLPTPRPVGRPLRPRPRRGRPRRRACPGPPRAPRRGGPRLGSSVRPSGRRGGSAMKAPAIDRPGNPAQNPQTGCHWRLARQCPTPRALAGKPPVAPGIRSSLPVAGSPPARRGAVLMTAFGLPGPGDDGHRLAAGHQPGPADAGAGGGAAASGGMAGGVGAWSGPRRSWPARRITKARRGSPRPPTWAAGTAGSSASRSRRSTAAPSRRRARVVADYPRGADRRARQTRQATIDLGPRPRPESESAPTTGDGR